MKMTEQTSRSAFANARMLSEGAFTPPQGDVVQTIYVDLAGQLPPEALSLAKGTVKLTDYRGTKPPHRVFRRGFTTDILGLSQLVMH